MQKASWHSQSVEQWSENEFGRAPLKDLRLVKRLKKLSACFARLPSGSIPKACGSWAQTKAAYRFFAQSTMEPADILAGHQEQTCLRAAEHPVVLVVQDTTGLNFSGDANLGLLGSGRDGARGLWLHSSMAFTPQGCALGIVKAHTWQRDPRHFGKAALRHERAMKDKESRRWLDSYEQCVSMAKRMPQTRLVSIADREGDIYPWFEKAQAHVGVLVRARHNRKTPEGPLLDEVLKNTPLSGVVELAVVRKPGQRARVARLEVRLCGVTIQAPSRCTGKALKLWLVDAREEKRQGVTPLHWRLITNLPVNNLEEALEKLQWYRVRWQIEEYYRVLKSGCQTEARQLESLEGLLRVLMVDMVVAWRVLELNRLARQQQLDPVEKHFSVVELRVICHWSKQQLNREVRNPNLREAVRIVAQMGGFLARRSDGEPGAITLYRGMETLAQLVAGWNLANIYG